MAYNGDEFQKPHETIAENDLVVRTVFGFVESRRDLVNCMTVSKGFFEIAVPYLYRCCIEYVLEVLESNKCDLVSKSSRPLCILIIDGAVYLTGRSVSRFTRAMSENLPSRSTLLHK
jgi:hypothetical protein